VNWQLSKTFISVVYAHIYGDRMPDGDLAQSKLLPLKHQLLIEKQFKFCFGHLFPLQNIIPQLAVQIIMHGTIETNMQD